MSSLPSTSNLSQMMGNLSLFSVPSLLDDLKKKEWLESDGPEHTLRWVENLDLIYQSRNLNKRCIVPFPHSQLDPLLACVFLNLKENLRNKNLLVAHVQFIVRMGSENPEKRICLDGGYLYFGERYNRKRKRISVFVSGTFPDNTDKSETEKKCTSLAKTIFSELRPSLEFFSNKNAENTTGNCHTEDWLLQCLKKKPDAIIANLFSAFIDYSTSHKSIEKPKLYAIVINLRSLWDVCDTPSSKGGKGCREMISTALKSKELYEKLQKELQAFFQISKKHSIRIVIRISSHKPFGFADRKRTTNWKAHQPSFHKGAGRGFDIKEASDKALILSSRTACLNPLKNRQIAKDEETLMTEILLAIADQFYNDKRYGEARKIYSELYNYSKNSIIEIRLRQIEKDKPLNDYQQKTNNIDTKKTQQKQLEKGSIPPMAFGKAKWEKYFGNIGVEPPLPKNIDTILNGPCPFWPNKMVKNTHMLTLIPNTVNGKSLTLDSLENLIQNPKTGYKTQYRYYYDCVIKKSSASHWVLMTRDVIPNSRRKSYEEQKKLMAQYVQKGYQLPYVLDATVSILMEHAHTNIKLYGNSPLTYTRCQEVFNNNPVTIGGFATSGFNFSHSSRAHSNHGVAGCRKF